jgi:dienelactone hydrolase
MRTKWLLGALLVCSLARSQGIHDQEIVIPWAQAGQGLHGLLVYADLPGKHPLAVLTHGTSLDMKDRHEVSPWAMLPQATWLARRGWVAMVVVRRGYGLSGGRPDYLNPYFLDAGRAAAEDLTAAIDYARGLPQVDASRILAAGISTGGFATVALTAVAPPGLVAAVNFAGNIGSHGDHTLPKADELVGAFRGFGKHSRTPMLWIYAENDKFIWPELARQCDAAFRGAGGQDQLIVAPAIGRDGHSLYNHIDAWSPLVDDFLKAQNLVWLPAPLPAPEAPAQAAPPGLTDIGQHIFHGYLMCGLHKAFAMSETSAGVSCAQLTPEEAKQKAIESCKHKPKSGKCKVVSVDGNDMHLSQGVTK